MIGGVLLVLVSTPAQAQSSADAFFHDAAQQYVNGNLEAARRAVQRGLETAPSDPRLQALQKKLAQQEKRRGGEGASQQGAQNQQQREKSRGQNAQQEQSREGGQENRSQADASSDQDASRRSETQSNQARDNAQDRNAQPRGSQDAPGGDGRQMSALSRVQAARLLQALENQEMKLLREVQVRAQEGATVEKDW